MCDAETRPNVSRLRFTDAQIEALIDAMDYVLDDMGPSGTSVCLATKAQARIAYEPFVDAAMADAIMSLDEAEKVVAGL